MILYTRLLELLPFSRQVLFCAWIYIHMHIYLYSYIRVINERLLELLPFSRQVFFSAWIHTYVHIFIVLHISYIRSCWYSCHSRCFFVSVDLHIYICTPRHMLYLGMLLVFPTFLSPGFFFLDLHTCVVYIYLVYEASDIPAFCSQIFFWRIDIYAYRCVELRICVYMYI